MSTTITAVRAGSMANASGLASIVILFVVPITWIPEQMIRGSCKWDELSIMARRPLRAIFGGRGAQSELSALPK
jgi:hypothetical protein